MSRHITLEKGDISVIFMETYPYVKTYNLREGRYKCNFYGYISLCQDI